MKSKLDILIRANIFRWLRESSGFSIEEVASLLKVNKEKIEEWESKDSSISLEYLKRLAKVYNVQLSAFFLNKPIENEFPTDFRRYTGVSKPLSKESIQVIRKARYLQYVAKILLEELKIEERNIDQYTTNDDPEQIAKNERGSILPRKISKDEDFFKILRSNIEKKGIFVFQFEMPLDDVRGFSFVDYPYTIVINSEDSINGKTFTLLHEYAHILLRNAGVCLTDFDIKIIDNHIVESWCNRFSASILLPNVNINKIIDNINKLDELSKELKVSKITIIIRALQLSNKDTDEYNLLKQYLEKINKEAEVNMEKRDRDRVLFYWGDIPLNKEIEVPNKLKQYLKSVSWIDNAKIYRKYEDDRNLILIKSPKDENIIIELKDNHAILSYDNEQELIVKKLGDKTAILKPFKTNIINKRKYEMGEKFINIVKNAYATDIINLHDAIQYLNLKSKYIEKLK